MGGVVQKKTGNEAGGTAAAPALRIVRKEPLAEDFAKIREGMCKPRPPTEQVGPISKETIGKITTRIATGKIDMAQVPEKEKEQIYGQWRAQVPKAGKATPTTDVDTPGCS